MCVCACIRMCLYIYNIDTESYCVYIYNIYILFPIFNLYYIFLPPSIYLNIETSLSYFLQYSALC